MLIKKSKIALLGMLLFSAIAITSCNNEEKPKEQAADTTKVEAPAPATADTTKVEDTTKIDTAKPRPIKNPG